MGKLILSLSSNIEDLKKNVIKHIDLKSVRENIIIVPDRFSLLTELSIFKEKNVQSVFNANVMPVSSFANFLFEKAGLYFESVSTFEQVLLTHRAMQKVKQDFVCLPKQTSPNLLQEISKTISQLKSSKVAPEQLQVSDVSPTLKAKFADLRLIYNEYEGLLGQKVDSGKLLEMFEENIESMSYLKNINLFFLGFDSFTNQIFELIKKLKNQVPFVVVGGFYHFSQANKKTFETDILEKFSTFSKDDNFKIEYCPTTIQGSQLAGFENMFAYKQKSHLNNGFARLISFNQTENEIDFITREIATKIKEENLRFSDFAIASSNLEEDKHLLENNLIKYGLNYFLDTQINLSNTSLSEFILVFFKLFITSFDKNTLKSFVSSYFVETDYQNRSKLNYLIEKYLTHTNKIENFESLLLEEDKASFFKNKSLFDDLKNFENKVQDATTVGEFVKTTKKLLQIFMAEEKCSLRANELEKENNLKQQKIYLQLYDKVVETLNSLELFLNEEKVTLHEFYQLLKLSFENKQVATVPISSDSVFVGDISQSFFGKVKYFYLIGASASRLPQTLFDGGILNDENLQEVNNSLKISPTVRAINKRNRFKLLNIFCFADINLTATYSFSNQDGKEDFASVFIEELSNILLQDNGEKLAIETATTLGVRLYEEEQKKLIMSFAGNEDILKQFLYKNAKGSLFEKRYINSVYNVLNEKNKIFAPEKQLLEGEKTLPKLKRASELFFINQKVSVSQLETYFRSPFLHFISYGLKLKDIETTDIGRLEIGNLMHFIAESFIKEVGLKTEEVSEKVLNEILNKIFAKVSRQTEFYKFFLNSENKNSLNYLKIEAKSMCEVILEHKKQSLFVPLHFEKSFEYKNYFNKKKLSISGRVDRIDGYKNDFIILDYKTGKVELSAKSVYLGQKIQLLVYADIYQKQTGKTCKGVFYFPIKNSYEEKQNKKMQGFFEKNNNVIFSLDRSISFEKPNSQIINANLKTNKTNLESGVYEFKEGTGTNFLQEMIFYAKKVCEHAIEEIESGHIAQVEGATQFLDGMFEDELCLKLKNLTNIDVKDNIFEKVGADNEN